jgi:hypothetical protein
MSRYQLWCDARQNLIDTIKPLISNPYDFSKDFVRKVSSIDVEVEKQLMNEYTSNPHKNQKLYYLALLCDLKKTKKSSEPELENLIINLYCETYLSRNIPDLDKVKVGNVWERKLMGKVLTRAPIFTKPLLTLRDE